MSSPNFAFSWNIMRSATLPGALFITKNASILTVKKKSNNAISSLFQTIFSSSTAYHDNKSNNSLINFKLMLGKKNSLLEIDIYLFCT